MIEEGQGETLGDQKSKKFERHWEPGNAPPRKAAQVFRRIQHLSQISRLCVTLRPGHWWEEDHVAVTRLES